MKFKGTYQELFAYSNELNTFAIQNPAVAKLLASGYKKFENRNKVALLYIREKLAKLYEENVEKSDETGGYAMNETGDNWKFKSKLHEDSFLADWQRLMSTEYTIVIGDDIQMQ